MLTPLHFSPAADTHDDDRIDRPMPVLLDDDAVWLVRAGRADVFVVSLADGQPDRRVKHLLRAHAGQAVFGLNAVRPAAGAALQAVFHGGTRVDRIPQAIFWQRARDTEDHESGMALRDWIEALCGTLVPDLVPKRSVTVACGERIDVAAASIVRPNAGLTWVRQIAGRSAYLGRTDCALAEGDGIPLSSRAWIAADGDGTLEAAGTEATIDSGDAAASLATLHRFVAGAATDIVRAEAEAAQRLAERRAAARDRCFTSAFSQIASTLQPRSAGHAAHPHSAASDGATVAACRLIADVCQISITRVPAVPGDTPESGLAALARASRFRVRRVHLVDDWWRHDQGALLALTRDEGRPVALLPAGSGGYRLHDLGRPAVEVTRAVAESLGPYGFTFYRRFPDRLLSVMEVMRFGSFACRGDLLMVSAMGVAGGVLGTIPPIATGLLINSIIPSAERGQLVQLTTILIVCAIAAALFQVVRTAALVRIESKMAATIQAAVWDRLLRLPLQFFRGYTAGNLAVRAMGVETMRQVMSGAAVRAILGGLLSIFNFALLFYYDSTLAWWATLMIAIAIGVTALLTYLQMQHQRAIAEFRAKTAGVVLQLLTGISKLRVAGAEPHAFSIWTRLFTAQRRLQFKVRRCTNWFAVFQAGFPPLTYIVVFAVVLSAAADGRTMRTGDFLAFISAYVTCLTATLTTGAALIAMLAVVPLFEMAKVILRATPEVVDTKTDPGVLHGDVTMDHVTFRYDEHAPPVLQDVSLHIRPGEFVAFVGPSGSGKSTLLRLLLGFEAPESGSIFYDGQNLQNLDAEAVRSQMGVVLQEGHVIPGDIYTNIVGASTATLDEAWEAARMAGLDEDLKQMPMGMHTPITQGSSTLSGGQRQRLMIARAIVGRPRLVFFDEATSALDNATQATVAESLKRLQATRLVVAHRLSSIVDADRIYVMDGGRIVSSGTCRELMEQPGLFRELAQRQLA